MVRNCMWSNTFLCFSSMKKFLLEATGGAESMPSSREYGRLLRSRFSIADGQEWSPIPSQRLSCLTPIRLFPSRHLPQVFPIGSQPPVSFYYFKVLILLCNSDITFNHVHIVCSLFKRHIPYMDFVYSQQCY